MASSFRPGQARARARDARERNPASCRVRRAALLTLTLLLTAKGTDAHPAPFSFLDLLIAPDGLRGSIVIHDLDAAHDLRIDPPDQLLDPSIAAHYRDRIQALIGTRVQVTSDGEARTLAWTGLEVVPERFGLRLSFTAGSRPAAVDLTARVFPFDPIHQTFVNVYEDGELRQQNILTADAPTMRFYTGTAQGRLAVVRAFVASGTEHILIGPDHVLFLVGLLLLGGTLRRLALIVTAFTAGHSVTLSLAALNVLSPPARVIEPLIALTIVVVGTDNLFVLHDRRAPPAATRAGTRDARPLFAGFFGLVHGFGFASVLKAFGLPEAALVWTLVSFNTGVEVGQLMIVVLAAGALAVAGRGRPVVAARLAWWGSIGVVLAGTSWFVDRLYWRGG